MKNRTWVFALSALMAVSFLGAGNVLLKFAYEGFDVMWCSALRFGIAAVVFGILFGRRAFHSLRSVPLKQWLVPSLCMAGSFIAAALSVNYVRATTAGFFFALPLLFAPGMSYFLSRKRIGKSTVAVQTVILGGLYLLCCDGGSLSFGIGEAMGLASSAFFAAALVTGERCLDKVDAISLTVAQVATTFLLSSALALATEPLPEMVEVPTISWVALFSLGILSTCLAFLLQNVALERISSTSSAVMVCIEPIFTSLLAMIFLGESLTMTGMIGGAIIVACTVFASLPIDSLKASLLKRFYPIYHT